MKLPLALKLSFLAVLLVLTAAWTSPWQYSDSETVNPKELGGLMVDIDRDGGVRVVLSIPIKVRDATALRQALLQSFSLPLSLDPPRQNPYLNNPKAAQALEKYQFTIIEAHNNQAFTEPSLVSSLKVQPEGLTRELRLQGIKTLMVTIVSQKTLSNLQVSGANKRGFPLYRFYQANISTENPGAAAIELSWGYQRHDLVIQVVPIALFILIPMILTIWVGQSVLRMKDRPREMWGRYFRYLMHLINGIWFVWFPIYAWSNMNEIVPAMMGPGARMYARVVGLSVWFGPPLLVMWLCHLLSHRVYRNVRGAQWSPAAVVRRGILAGSLAFIPLFSFMFGIGVAGSDLRRVALVMVLVATGTFLFIGLFGKSLRLSPYSVTRGELRDRVFELAARAGVKLSQIYVLPDSKAQLANAFARSDNAVMLTASLLRHLSKREIDAIMGHEIGHLKEKHPHRKNTITMVTLIGAQIVASGFASMIDLQRWAPALLSFAFAGAILVLHFLSRSNERHADAIGIGLTGDPEAFISGLAKLEAFNLMPIHGGGAIEFGTHPRTLGRVQDIAHRHSVSADRLQILLSGEEKSEDHYQLEGSGAKAFSTEFKQGYVTKVSLLILATVVLTPIFAAFMISRLPFTGATQFGIYAGVALLTLLVLQVVRNFALSWGFGSVEQTIRARMSQQGLTQAAREGIFVGLAPSARLRRYEQLAFWDVGLLWFAGDRLLYLGEETAFALNRQQIVGTRVARIDPAAVPRNCLFVDWRNDAIGNCGRFYLTAARSILQSRREVYELDQRIDQWRSEPQASRTFPEPLPNLPLPSFGVITSQAPKNRFEPMMFMKAILKLSIASCVLSFAFRLTFWSACYAIAVTTLLVLVDELPKLFLGAPMHESAKQPPPEYQRTAWMESDAITKR
jgi:heat shock protein HtpX